MYGWTITRVYSIGRIVSKFGRILSEFFNYNKITLRIDLGFYKR